MKDIFIIVLIFSTLGSFEALAQESMVRLKDGSDQQVYITNIDSIYLTTSKGIYSISDIEEVVFEKKRGKDLHTYYKLEDAGLKIRFDKSIELEVPPPAVGDDPKDQMEQFHRSFYEYKKTNQLASGLQFSGLLLGVIGLIIEEDALLYTGAAASGAGLVLKIKANYTPPPEEE